jgi:hypothetical protein
MVENKKRKKKGEAGARLKEQQAVQEKVIADKPKTFTVDGKQVSESEFEKSKRTTGTSQKSTKESELLAQKAEATRVGLKEAGATLTPQIVAGLQAREQAQVAQAPVLREEGVFEDRPTEQVDLTREAFTGEGIAEIKQEAGTELVQQRLIKFSPEERNDAKAKIVNSIQDTVGAGILSSKTVGEVASGVPFVGDIITGITGDRGEIVQNVQSSLEARNQMATKIGTLVKEGSMDAEDGFKALKKMEAELNADVTILKREAILSPAVRRSGEIIDIQVDLLELEQEIFDAKIQVAGGAIQETDPSIINTRLKEIDDINRRANR